MLPADLFTSPEGFQKLKHLHVQNNAEFANVINGKVGFPNLTWLAVSELNGLRFLMTSSVARSLRQLKRLQISGCQIMEAIISIEESDEEIEENVFCQLQDLELKDLPNLTLFCSSRSSKPDKFTFDSVNRSSTICEIEESDSKGNQDIVIQLQPFLFDKKVEFPNLKKLFIEGLAKLTTIWNNQLSVESSKNLESIEIVSCEGLKSICPASVARGLQQLTRLIVRNSGVEEIISNKAKQKRESIEIDSCESLKHIFPASMVRDLQQLRRLEVKKCGVEEIIANEEGQQTTPKFVFSKVTYALFDGLPKLRSFYPGMNASSWPSLNYMGVFGCDKVQIFAEEYSNFQEQREATNLSNPINPSLFIIEKDSFPNLEYLALDGLEIWNGPLPVQLFSKLKHLAVAGSMSKSVIFLDSLLPDLEGNRHSSAVGMGAQLPNLRVLKLIRMYKLMHIGEEDNSQSARPNFPNLEFLFVNGCHGLRNLRSSAIPFNNLTSLHVSWCKGLKYLVTYSMAKSFIHLTKLEVGGCRRLVEIVGNNEDDDDSGNYEITFRRLKHLKLFRLPRLRGFCSRGNCSVKFPSLETLSISNRLKLKIFQTIGDETLQTTNEEEDTDVDAWEAETTAEDEKTRQAPI
ncbi:hypothetical protein M0R45_018835 [Rubus argutus]|uniref:Disease resistance protein At4g27190-like leucine-rich repeats domain-containing protein n=1 Tax=Rubus argutus TaxID=59490 RepID=A0AAW1X5I7_RUBAR